MATHQEIPPLPSSRDYLQTTQMLDGKFRRVRSMLLAISQEIAPLPIHQTRQYMQRARQWGSVIESVDRSTGVVDGRLTTTEAFVFGSAAGLAVTAHAHRGVATGTNMVHAFDSLRFSSEDDDDEDHYKHKIAEELVELSGLGLMAMGEEAEAIVEGWEERCVPDATKQIMFRRGAGMAAFLACRIHQQRFNAQEQARLEQALFAAVEL